MKTFYIRLQILLIIILVFSPLLYLGYKKLSPQLDLYLYDLSAQQTIYPISTLHTQDTKILNDKNEPIRLRGVNLISTNWGDKYNDWNPKAIEHAAKNWHINVIRTRIYEHEYVENPAKFFLNLETQILDPARKNGLYVIIHPWFGENDSLPDNEGIKMWLSIANRYKNDPHIIYDLLAEPRDTTFDTVFNTYTSLIPKIRSISPNSLIMVTGLDWGRDINAYLDSPLPYTNLVYRVNPYNKTAEFPGLFGKIAEKYPVFFGEFGTEDKLSMTIQDVQNVMAYADKLSIGWTAWHFTSSGCPCLLSNELDFTPTPYGDLVKANLAGTTWPFTLPTFDTDPTKLYVYSDFLESGFSDYSWGISNQLGTTISTNFHNGAGIYFSTPRRIDPKTFKSFVLTIDSKEAGKFSLRFKSWDNKLSNSYLLKNGPNAIGISDIQLDSISGILIESNETIPDPTILKIDHIYFRK
jgi:hypothetical protein